MSQILIAILGIALLITVHEAGHYLAARVCGMRVSAFSIGIGPALLRVRPRGSPTTFQLCVLPLMAYVKVEGMNPLEAHDPDDEGLYENKSAFARALMVLGGPLANYLAASVIVFVVALTGWPEHVPTTPMVVEKAEVGAPGATAGIQAGDVIVAVEGHPVRDVGELAAQTGPRAGLPTTYTIERDGVTLPPLTVVPRNAGGRGVIGITPKTETHLRAISLGRAATMAVTLPWVITVDNVRGIADLARRRSTDGLTGPVGMVKQVALEAEKGPLAYIGILMMLSIAMGFFNILPLPFLDGGRLVFLAVEIALGRRPNQKVEMLVHAVGLVLLLGMTALITLRDIVG